MKAYFRKPSLVDVWDNPLVTLTIFRTSTGDQTGNPGDYVIDYGGVPGSDTAPYPVPKEFFERTYISGTGLNFGLAILALKAGRCIQRAGWNGKGMHVYLLEMSGYEPCMVLYTAAGTHQPGWNASTPDVLADDWQVLD